MKPTYIVNESKRKKKLHEISTLCGIQTCAIIYGPNETKTKLWPSHSEVQRVINKFNAMSEIDQRKNIKLFEEKLQKVRDQLKKARDENKKNEIELFMFQCWVSEALLTKRLGWSADLANGRGNVMISFRGFNLLRGCGNDPSFP
ncbi:hypothetical protein Lal_00038838 [Lupinus albus]|nr:hypothetical protein Lal_00038838 [Lupinus albus]